MGVKFKFAVCAFFYAACCHADFLPAPVPEGARYWPGGKSYYIPNEHHPERAAGILQEAAPGVHLSVGTERGFIGFAMNPNATHLLLTDVDPKVVQFNRLNIALLQSAKDEADYRHLRFSADYAEWKKRLKIGKEEFSWWQEYVRENRPFQKSMEEFPRGSHYLSNPDWFRRLHAAAQAGHLQAVFSDLSNKSHMDKLAKAMRSKKLKFGLLDVSNAWISYNFMHQAGMNTFVGAIATATNPEAVLLATNEERRVVGFMSTKEWEFGGFTWKEILAAAKEKLPLSNFIAKEFRAHGGSCAPTFAKILADAANPWRQAPPRKH